METLVSILVPTAVGTAPPSLSLSEKTPRPLGTNTPAQFAYPIYSVQKETEKRHSQRCAVSLIYSIFCAQIMEIFEPLLLFSG